MGLLLGGGAILVGNTGQRLQYAAYLLFQRRPGEPRGRPAQRGYPVERGPDIGRDAERVAWLCHSDRDTADHAVDQHLKSRRTRGSSELGVFAAWSRGVEQQLVG